LSNFITRIFDQWIDQIPTACALCGGTAGREGLCTDCIELLPPLPACCPICGDRSTLAEQCGACLRQPPPFDAVYAPHAYDWPLSAWIQAFKSGRLDLAGPLVARMLTRPPADEASTILVPVPLSNKKLRLRGYNQAAELGRPLAQALQLEWRPDWVSRTQDGAEQKGRRRSERLKALRGHFRAHPAVAGRTVIVVDDVITTGATLAAVARALKSAGALRVIGWVAARTLSD
jgi:ComF family protein